MWNLVSKFRVVLRNCNLIIRTLHFRFRLKTCFMKILLILPKFHEKTLSRPDVHVHSSPIYGHHVKWRKTMKLVEILQVGIFQWGVWWVGIFRVGIFPMRSFPRTEDLMYIVFKFFHVCRWLSYQQRPIFFSEHSLGFEKCFCRTKAAA